MAGHDSRRGTPTDTDAALLGLIKGKNEAALSALYESRSRLVYSLALSIVRNVADAEEVTQEVFVRLWQKAETFDPLRGSGVAWLITMTRRLAIDRTRSKHFKSRNREISLDGMILDGAYEKRGGDRNSGVNHAQAREVLDALNRLDGPHREVIQLSYFEGLSHSKIADHLKTPLGTVKSRLREAVIQLRRMLDVGS
jgi:RNA polymerase sigma-70 factor (ECF subfamily)